MAVYVDDLENYGKWRHGQSCHMYTDGNIEELHALASKIGLKRSWFQDKKIGHYDLTANKRQQAIAAGAQPMPSSHLGQLLRQQNKTVMVTYQRCATCKEPVQDHNATCYRCGRAVHWNEPVCGGWILDSWHPMANDPDDGNEYWCNDCLDKKDPATLPACEKVTVAVAVSEDDHPF